MKKFKVKFDNFSCPACRETLFVQDIYKKLQEQYEMPKNSDGYLTILTAQCKCGHTYKIYCDCHEIKDNITVCVRGISETGWRSREV
jgi:hypothetical protein